MTTNDMFALTRDAVISPCGKYRYLLRRQLADKGDRRCLFLMLNPSTADAIDDDATIRRCMAFARSWGFQWLHMANLFAWRATDPEAMLAASDPIGPSNDSHLVHAAGNADLIVCAWGKDGASFGRADAVRRLLAHRDLHYLVLNADGSPRHPLYVSGDTRPTLWEQAPNEVSNHG